MTEPHQQRGAAESFGAEAERYDRTRPSYPQDLIHRIAEHSPGPRVLDVGCGTGIAARQFRDEKRDVLGLDVDARMAEQARRQGLEVEVSKFEDWDAKGRVFDTVAAAQAWHWVDPFAGAVKAAEILNPAGRIALIWNVFEPEPSARTALAVVQQSVLPDFPNIWAGDRPILETYGLMFAKAEEGLDKSGNFTLVERWRIDWERVYTKKDWLDQLPTFGGMSRLPKDTMAELLAATDRAIGDSFLMRYTTVAVTATKK
ncbi:class I SAM-dependent methyltransferase [Paractinoplanes durhamensis]|uniref:Methyltransferase type 11 n=1 Tax=Paractinoplanes durhamensis TaxID=113563 RepID=A0ABQ3ZCV6_9ACTN|nr:class I SAM-dependent methyltransferase [Actinoplanes durhamensis]GIE07379.1 methyltransferase type 11 [Actinoplanes durhamensis]